ncbi:AI-2E family transporter [Mediterraneibacter sp. NSJ-55]|uniref:AI-2E family transporter n=1 Tax=Mediterraneibacter hominis TaxID=2763054 RepID=A0A923LGF4_9FIRM|nr:AI-2E family transporter [Mediterraneibacter hominis]MBC5688270.1 AI-2E family transporter [Mediterraneibacter hominis]
MKEETQQDVQKREPPKSGYYIKQPVLKNKGASKLRQQFGKGMTIFVVIAACILFYFALLRLTIISDILAKIIHVLKPIIYGMAIAYLLNPIVKFADRHLLPVIKKKFPKLKKKEQLTRGMGIMAGLLVLIAVVVALFNMMIPELYRSIRDMVITVPSQMNHFLESFSKMNAENSAIGKFAAEVLAEAAKFLQNWMRTDLLEQVNVVMSGLTVGVINIISEMLNIVIGMIVSVYVLFSKEKFSRQCKKIVYAVFKPSNANMILHLTIKSNEIFGGFIIGKIIDSAIIGVLCFIGLSLLDMPYTMLVSVIVGVTNVIPFFGPYIGAIPSAILILLSDPRMGIYFIIFILCLQQLDGNIIGPKILGDSTGLSAFWVVFSILLGGGLFGFLGMILGVPTFAVIYYIVNMIVNNRLERKKLPTNTNCYDKFSYVDSDGTYVHSDENEMNNTERGEKKHADSSTK